MNDKEFLEWLHERLEHVYKENPLVDYMHKLRAIIRDTPPDKVSPNTDTCNSLEELRERFKVKLVLVDIELKKNEWCKTLDGVDKSQVAGRIFEGSFLNPGEVELNKGQHLVFGEQNQYSRKYRFATVGSVDLIHHEETFTNRQMVSARKFAEDLLNKG